MPNEEQGKTMYIQALEVYHKGLEKILNQQYKIEAEYLEVIGWGYVSTAMYVKDVKGNEYVVRIGLYNEEKINKIEKDYKVTEYLYNVIPTARCIPDAKGTPYITFYDEEVLELAGSEKSLSTNEKRVLRVSEYVTGIPPFDINFNIFREAIQCLKAVHANPIPDFELPKIKNTDKPKLLHGDLTPSNILVSHDRLAAIVDFEESAIGPAEWDIARTALFAWLRMKDVKIDKVLEEAYAAYKEDSLSFQRLIDYSLENATIHLNNIVEHKEIYDTPKKWEDDYNFTKSKIKELTQSELFSGKA